MGDAPLAGLGIGVTGAGGHLGRALAVGLAEAGAVVLACGRREAPLRATAQAAAGAAGRVVPCPADVSCAADVERALDRLEAEAGAVDGWVNNAYGAPARRLFELDRASVMAALASGLGDLVLATEAVARRMRPRRRGAIVNVASMYGLVSPQ